MQLRSIISPAWLLAIALSALMLFALQWFRNDLLFERTLINNGEWWRLISGNFVHNTLNHLYMNLLGLLLLGLLFHEHFTIKWFAVSTFFLSIIVGLGLYFYAPNLNMYVGFSGILYGLYLVAAINAIKHKDLITGIGILVIIIGKLFWDLLDPTLNDSSAELIGISIATESHWLGASGGIILGLLYYFFTRHDQTTSPT